jgi:hypothetical protein
VPVSQPDLTRDRTAVVVDHCLSHRGKTATGSAPKAALPLGQAGLGASSRLAFGALGCFVAGYGAHALGGATKSIQKAVQTRLPASLKTMLPSLGFATPKKLLSPPAVHEGKPAEKPRPLQAAATYPTAGEPVAVARETQPEKPTHEPPRQPQPQPQPQPQQQGPGESEKAKDTSEGPPEAVVAAAGGETGASTEGTRTEGTEARAGVAAQ